MHIRTQDSVGFSANQHQTEQNNRCLAPCPIKIPWLLPLAQVPSGHNILPSAFVRLFSLLYPCYCYHRCGYEPVRIPSSLKRAAMLCRLPLFP
jgi:hypothetical protein